MSTRRWFVDLAKWMRQEGITQEEVARGSGHKVAHVRLLFDDPSPNPSLQLYLDLLTAAGAGLLGVEENTPRAVIERVRAVMDKRDITLSGLARLADVNRSQLSTLFNADDPSPKLAIIDRIVDALEADQELLIVAADVVSADDADNDEDDGDADDEVDDEVDGDADDEVDDDEVDDDDDDADDEVDDDDADDAADANDDEVDDDDADEVDDDDDDDDDDDADDDDDDEADADAADDSAVDDDELAAEIRTLQAQNAELRRTAAVREAELRKLKAGKSGLRKAAEWIGGLLVVGGAAYVATRPSRKDPPKE